MIGMILKGRYCILEQLGQGGEGHLYLARDMELGCLWAVKEIPVSAKKEAKLLRLLEHPSIPKMVDYAEREAYCYLVMEYIRGKSLGQWLREGRLFSVPETIELALTTAEAMEYLHTRKPAVFYGDLKPDNLMLQENGRLYVVDFGSAVPGYGKVQRICKGTRGYAAPEQYGGSVSAASDIYAFGRTFLELMGKRPWKAFLDCPWIFLIFQRCGCSQVKWRCADMKTVKEELAALKKKYRAKRYGAWVLGAIVFLAAVGGTLLRSGEEEKSPGIEFRQAITKAVDVYYREDFLNGKNREAVCKGAEECLKKLLGEYKNKEAQRRILLLLGLNSEYAGEPEKAEMYYRQLLLCDPGFREVYGEYGIFLWKQSQEEASEKLWEEYKELEKRGLLEEEKGRNLEVWQAYIEGNQEGNI